MYELNLLESVRQVDAALFERFEGPERFPFLRRAFLAAFEETGCLGAERGWIPRHLVIRRGREVIAFAPAYIKLHSFGEFVFDQQIADFAETRLGLRYYPKWILAVPFTPATGPRVLFLRDLAAGERAQVLELLTHAVPELCEELGVSSVHVLFPDARSAGELEGLGWARRSGLQFQFSNRSYADFEGFLGDFRAKRRAVIRRERRELAASGLSIRALTGPALTELSPRLAYELYLTTVDKYVWGRRYLTEGFFERVLEEMPDAVHFVLAEDAGGRPVAGAFNLLGSEALYGRYWGAFREVPFLHFEVCLYRGIEECIARRLARFEPGAGGEHKEGRGFSPTETRSVHYFADARLERVVRDFFERERRALAQRIHGEEPRG